MPDYVNITTLELHRSASQQPAGTAKITRAQYDAALLIERKYRKWVDPNVVEMDAGEKAAVDAADAAALVSTNRAAAVLVPDDVDTPEGWRIREIIELFNKRDNYLTNRIAELQEDLQAIKASSGPADNIRAAIRASYLVTNTRTRALAVQAYKDDINAGEVDS